MLLVVVAVPAAAALYSLQQASVYQASAEVLLQHRNLAAGLTGVNDSSGSEDPTRLAETQASLARVQPLAARVLKANGMDERSTDAFLDHSSVSAATNADLLTFTVRDGDPDVASRLATSYARQYTLYRQQLDTVAILRAKREADARLGQLRANGESDSPVYKSLAENAQTLDTLAALQTSNAFLVQPAGPADQVEPNLARNVGLAFALAIVLGIGVAFLWDALDTRVRSAEEVATTLGVPLLGRLSEPSRRLRSKGRLATIGEPTGTAAEALRVLRTNLEFANLDRRATTIMVTSAVEGEGKSVTVANLAVTLARAGTRVVLVDLDLRRPSLHRLFGLEQRPGLTDVALGHASLDDALRRTAVTADDPLRRIAMSIDIPSNGNGARTRVEGLLQVLTSGPTPPDPGEFVGTTALARILEELREHADVVLVDSSSLLHVGDSLALTRTVDAVLVVARLNALRRPMLRELRRVLDSCPAETLGVVATGADKHIGSGYGTDRHAQQPTREEERVS